MFFVLKPLKSKHYSTKFIKYIVPLGLGFAFLGLVYFLHLKTGTLIVDYKTPEKENVGQNKKQTLTESPSIEVASLPAKLPKEKDPPWCSTDNYTDLANHPSFEKFNQWVGEWNQIVCPPDILCVHDPRKINNLISKGKSLVKERSLILKRIIRGDPEKAIQLAFPKETISQLPQGIKEHIERWENDIADVAAIHVCFDTKHPKGLINRYVSFPGGRKLKTYVYGNRRNISSKRGVSIWGISLNGEMAMSDKPIQVKRNPQNGRQSIVFDGQELTFTSEVQLKLFEEEIHQLEKKAAFTRTSVSYPMIAASSGLDEYYEKKYDLIETPMTWAEANQTAFESNGRLVIIGSVQENNFIRKLLQKVERGISQGGGAVTYSWIGATDNEDQNGSTYDIENNLSSIIEVNAIEGDWKWLNGEDVNGTYSNWINSTEPNNTDNPDQDFAAMDWSTSAGMWKDLNSSYRLPFVIEYDLGNEPSAISVAVDGYRKVLVVPARFMDEGYSYDGSSSPLVDRQGNPLSPDGQLDSFDPVTPENLAQAMKEVKDFYLRNSDGTFHLEPVISPTVTLPFNKYNKLRGSGEDNLFDTGGGYFTTANITHKELDPLEGLGEVGIVQAAALSSKWDFFGPAFVGVSQITLAQPLVGTGFKKPPTITFSGGNILNGNNDPNFISAEAEAFVNANGEITGIKILNPGAYYHSSPQLLVNGDNALSNQFVIKIDNICVSWVVITTHEPGSPGVGYIGRAGSHVDAGMNGSVSSGTIAHELGHNFGLFHANRYISESEKPNSDEGTFVEYGSPFSVMGSAKDIANYGDFTIPSKVATKKFNGFGLTIGNSIGKDVAEILSPSDLNSSPLKEFGDSSYQSNSNLFRIYRHDYGSAPCLYSWLNLMSPFPPRNEIFFQTIHIMKLKSVARERELQDSC